MIIQIDKQISNNRILKIQEFLNNHNYKTTEVKTQKGHYIIGVGSTDVDIRQIGSMDGIQDIHRVSDNYKLVSRKWKITPTQINLDNDIIIGEGHFCLMLGPCAIEGEEQIADTISFLKKNNVKIMRGGVFKPRSSPYSFRGRGLECLKSFYKIAHQEGIKIITEVMNIQQIGQMVDYVDIFQVGARNTQNFSLLEELGKVDKPILIKRGLSGTIDELLHSAEYIFSSGNEKLILCERGIRTFENIYRNTLDLNAVSILKSKTHLPVIVDPSHGVGIREHVAPMGLAAIMAGCDGLLVEIHRQPQQAFSDGMQTLDFSEAKQFIKKTRKTFKFYMNLNNEL